MRFIMATSSFLDVWEIFLVASSAFATRLEGKSRLRARVVDTAETPFTLSRIQKFKNAALFLRLGLPSALIHHENGAFRKRSRRILKLASTLRFSEDRKHFANIAFWKRWRHDDHVISLTEISSNANAKCAGDCCVFKFYWLSVDEKHFMRFQSENAVFEISPT